MVAKLKAIKVELQRRKHDRMAEVGAWFRKVVLGYYQYHAVSRNTTQLRIFKLRVCSLLQSVLVRRSQRAEMRWERLTPVLNRWIPPPPYPAPLSRCTLLRHSSFVRAVCVDALVRICAGAVSNGVPTATIMGLWKSCRPSVTREEEVTRERHPVGLNAKTVSAVPMQLPMGERRIPQRLKPRCRS
jgi:hypothetical protein